MTIGETLKRARKKMDLTLEHVAQTTKIAKMFLIALENDDISSLPPGVYTRNFLRIYAKFLRLDEDIITAEYHQQYAVKPQFVAQHEQTKKDNFQFKKKRNRYLMILFILIAIPVAGFFLYQKYGQEINGFFRQRGELSPLATTEQKTVQPPLDTQAKNEKKEEKPLAEGLAEPFEQARPAAGREEEQGSDEGDVVGEGGLGSETDAEPVSDKPTQFPAEEPQIEEPVFLPVIRLEDVFWTPPENPGSDIEEMFAIEGLARVWVKVTIDGVVLSERYLDKGQVRFYRYGEVNSVIVGDSRYVVIQAGTAFRKFPKTVSTTIAVDGFGAGDFIKAVNANLSRFLPAED